MKIIHIVLKVLFSLVMVLPILGAFGIMPAPTRELYQTDIGFDFINIIFMSRYINILMSSVFIATLYLIWTRREAFAAVLVVPIVLNIIGFHLFLDGGILNGGAVPAIMMVALNAYFLYRNREQYKILLTKV